MTKPDIDLAAFCPLTVASALARAASIAPDVEAIVATDGRITYGALALEVDAIRSALVVRGVRKGDHVGLCLGNSARWVATFLALGSLGAVTVPVNTRFVASEMAYALHQSQVSTLITCDRFLKVDFIAMLREICPGIDASLPHPALPLLKRLIVIGEDVPACAVGWDTMMQAADDGSTNAKPKCEADDPLLIQYTSGTTSFPKGVLLTHRNMLANAYFSGLRMGLRPADRFHSARPFFHVAGTTLSILSAVQHAVTLVSMDRFEPGEALRLMEAERCTHFSGNDTMALMLLNHPDRPARALALRGAWLAASPTVIRRVIDELGARECVVGYGLSEASPNVAQSCFWEPEEVRVSAAMRVQPGVTVRIRAADGHDARIGEAGEILVRGWNVMREYFDKPKESADALDADGWLSTGDLGHLDEAGRLTFLGRTKDIVRVGGENVSPADVENTLHRHHAIRQAAVVGVPDERLVEVTAAFIILNEGHSVSPEDIMLWAKSEMAGFKVPRHVWIVDDFEAIGMTASAKIQKSNSPRMHASCLDFEDMNIRIETPVTRLLGIDLPIIQAGMSWASSNAALPLAVSQSGGLGVIAAGPMYRDDLAEAIDAVRANTDRPFAVNLPLYRKGAEEIIDLLIEKRVPVLIASQGGPKKYLDRFKAVGTVCLHVVAGEEHARKAADAGVDGLIAVGGEAGGHPPPDLVSTLVLGRAIAKAAPDTPLILSGGFADGSGLAAALALGAGAAQFGTRFMLSHEARLHPAYRELLAQAGIGDTLVVGRGFGMIRVLRNGFADRMAEAEQRGASEEERRGLFAASTLKAAAFDGDVELGKLEAGQSAGLVTEILPAAEIVRQIAAEYAATLAALPHPVFEDSQERHSHAG